MERRAAVAALTGIVLSIAAGQGCRRNAAPPLSLAVGASGPVSFPPSDEAWSERTPIAELSSPTTLMPEHALKGLENIFVGFFKRHGKIVARHPFDHKRAGGLPDSGAANGRFGIDTGKVRIAKALRPKGEANGVFNAVAGSG